MAFGQYSKTTNNIVTAPTQDDDNTTAGSSSFSSWNDLLKSQPRKPRAMGRVKPLLVSRFFEACFSLVCYFDFVLWESRQSTRIPAYKQHCKSVTSRLF